MKLEASADSEGTPFFPFLAELTRELTARNAELKMEQNGSQSYAGGRGELSRSEAGTRERSSFFCGFGEHPRLGRGLGRPACHEGDQANQATPSDSPRAVGHELGKQRRHERGTRSTLLIR